MHPIQVQDKSADLLMRLDLISGGISVLVNVFLGSYSDVLGRRFVLLLCLSGHFLRNVTAPVIIYWNLGLPALYSGYVIDGLCGGSSGECVKRREGGGNTKLTAIVFKDFPPSTMAMPLIGYVEDCLVSV